jgi:protoporphyrinogen oxidase
MAEIAVVGAGLAGLTCALRLGQQGYRVGVFERYPRPGGLARAFEVGGEPLEAFYHHLFTSDTAYVGLAEELGVGPLIDWLPSRMGIWTDDRLWDFGTPTSLLRFRPLRLFDKVRFALATLYLQHRADPAPYEGVTAAQWVRKYQGERVWRTVWGPLLYQKFADEAEQVAMVWLWGKLRLRGRSRSKSGMGEQLGYMRGSFARLVDVLEQRIIEHGGEFHLTEPVRRIDRQGDAFQLATKAGTFTASEVVAATPVPDYLDIAGHLLEESEHQRLAELKATGAICTVLEMSNSLTPYYWLNIADSDMPFGGLVEHTNYIPAERYGGRHVLYISNYLFPDHPLYRAPKSRVLETYLPALTRINPEFDASWIFASHHFRADYAQPVVTRGYRGQIPSMRSSVPGLYLCCMAQIFPEDRGQNYAIIYGDRVARVVTEDLQSKSEKRKAQSENSTAGA